MSFLLLYLIMDLCKSFVIMKIPLIVPSYRSAKLCYKMSTEGPKYKVENTDIVLYPQDFDPNGHKTPDDYILQKEDKSIIEEVHTDNNQYTYSLTWKKENQLKENEDKAELKVKGGTESLKLVSLRGVLTSGPMRLYSGQMYNRSKLERQWVQGIINAICNHNAKDSGNTKDNDFLFVMSYSKLFEFNYDIRIMSLPKESKELIDVICDNHSLPVWVPHGYGFSGTNHIFYINGIGFVPKIPKLSFDLTLGKLTYRINRGKNITILRGDNSICIKCKFDKGRIVGKITPLKGWEQNNDKYFRDFNSEKVEYSGKIELYEDIQYSGYGELKIGNKTYRGCFLSNENMATCRLSNEGTKEVCICRICDKIKIYEYKEQEQKQAFEGDCFKWAIVTDTITNEKWLLICLDEREDFVVEEGAVIFQYGYDERRVETNIQVDKIKWNKGTKSSRPLNPRPGQNKEGEMSLEEFHKLFPNNAVFPKELDFLYDLSSIPETATSQVKTEKARKVDCEVSTISTDGFNRSITLETLYTSMNLDQVDDYDADLDRTIAESVLDY